ncbi:MAG: hypothetical protein AAGK32_05390 [Actinomycetota bacterium]
MILYVSWGGSGRPASLRQAMREALAAAAAGDPDTAAEGSPGLRYLAILDDGNFGDLDEPTIRIVTDELRWLLDTQVDLTRHQVGAADLPVEVVVRRGDVVEGVVDVLGERGPARVLLGAPVAPGGHESVEALRAAMSARLQTEVEVVAPAGP